MGTNYAYPAGFSQREHDAAMADAPECQFCDRYLERTGRGDPSFDWHCRECEPEYFVRED